MPRYSPITVRNVIFRSVSMQLERVTTSDANDAPAYLGSWMPYRGMALSVTAGSALGRPSSSSSITGRCSGRRPNVP